MPRGTFQDCCCQCSCLCGEPLLTPASAGDPPALAGSFGSVSCAVTAPFLWVLVSARFCLYPPRLESLFSPQSCGSPVIKSYWPSVSDSLGIPNPFVASPGWEAWLNLHNRVRASLVLCFLVCGSPTQRVWDLILLCLHPPTVSLWLVFRHGAFFLVGSSVFLLMAVQQLVVILVLSQEEISTRPSSPPSWTGSPHQFFLFGWLVVLFCF